MSYNASQQAIRQNARQAILSEYSEVLHRKRFHFAEESIQAFLDLVKTFLQFAPTESTEKFPDPDDRVFLCSDSAERR